MSDDINQAIVDLAYRNGGREWRPKGRPLSVNVHDFPDKDLGKAIPYGIYDVTHNMGWVSVGVDHDTAAFAVETLRRWWHRMGRCAHPKAHRLLVTADGAVRTAAGTGCGNGSFSALPMTRVFGSRYVTFLRGPASGTRSNIGCSATLPRTGVAGR